MAIDTPVQAMKKLHGSKDKLISSVVSSAKREGESDADATSRLTSVSNQKLLRMEAVAKQLADRGGRDNVVAAIGDAMSRSNDGDYLVKLATFSNGKLMDTLRRAEKRAK